jgi:nucleotide-binding universal stress UspA family protein
MLTLRRPSPTHPVRSPSRTSARRPVVLATLEAPLAPEAVRIGVDSAVESGQPLLVVNAVETWLAPCSRVLGYDYIAPPDVEASLRSAAALAHDLGVDVERFCIRSTNPVGALIDFAGERGAGLLVLGPDAQRISARRYRRAGRKVCDEAACLVWIQPD